MSGSSEPELDALHELLVQARDRSSLSEELALQADHWSRIPHLHPARGNVIRALDLPAEARVLELGAGTGALTRVLGERCAQVDAVEEKPELVRLAAARTADQPNVGVFAGDAGSIPPEARYELVVIGDAFRGWFAGARTEQAAMHRLREAAERLTPGGALVLTLPNPLGVRYAAGAPDELTGDATVSLAARWNVPGTLLWSRRGLMRMLRAADMRCDILCAFPDARFARAIFGERLLREQPQLAWQLPHFAGDPWSQAEFALWKGLVQQHDALDFANGLVVVAYREPARHELWPSQRLAALYQPGRRPRYATQTEFRSEAGDVTVIRSALWAGLRNDTLQLRTGSEPFIAGTALLDALETAPPAERTNLLLRWRTLVEEAGDTPVHIDRIPANVIVEEAGALRCIDDEWTDSSYSAEDVVRRGVLLTGVALAERGCVSGARTAADVVRSIAMDVLGTAEDDWIGPTLDREARLQAAVFLPPAPGPDADIVAIKRRELEDRLQQPVAGARSAAADQTGARLLIELRNVVERAADVQRELDSIKASRSWRYTQAVRSSRRLLRPRS